MQIHVEQQPSVLRGYLLRYRFYSHENHVSPGAFLEGTRGHLVNFVQQTVRQHAGVKFQVRMSIQFFKPTDDDKEIVARFISNPEIALAATNLTDVCTAAFHTVWSALTISKALAPAGPSETSSTLHFTSQSMFRWLDPPTCHYLENWLPNVPL